MGWWWVANSGGVPKRPPTSQLRVLRLVGGEGKGKPLRLAFQAREGTGCGCGSSGLGRGNGGGGGRVVPVHVGLVV
jgi:hypothetical protein